MALTEDQEEALVLIYMQELDSIGGRLLGAVDELEALGLAGGPAGQWAVTPAGRAIAEQMTDD